MGLLKDLIIIAALNKAEEAIAGKNTEEKNNKNKQKTTKPPLFESLEEFNLAVFALFMFSQVTYGFFIIVKQPDSLTWAVFYRLYAMAAFVSCALLLIGLVAYGLYLIDFLPMIFLMIGPLFCLLAFTVLDRGAEFFFGTWMNSATKLVFTLLGIGIFAVSFAYMIYCETKGESKEIKKHTPKSADDKESERNCSLLNAAIQENAISVRFTKRQWGFKTGEDVKFGFDCENNQLVFVNDRNSHILSYKGIVFLEYEEVNGNPDAAVNTRQYERLIKLYYLGSNNNEHIIPLVQVFVNDTNINVIKYYANNSPASNDEVVFRRKIRHLASTLDKDYYPRRPFVNDGWFDLLKGCMEGTKNLKTDGYSLFRYNVIANEDFMDDATLLSIICDLSIDPPDKTGAQKEAKRLCLCDFKETMGNGIKSSIKSLFQ